MAKHKFKDIKLNKKTLAIIEVANSIIAEYQDMRLRLTLRQLYYQFVSRDLLPNTERSYKNLGGVISKGRLCGLIDWDAIEDRTRRPVVPGEFDSIDQLVQAAIIGFRLPRRAGQEHYVELWVEKDALAGVLSPIASRYHVPLMVNRGYSSSSAMYAAAERILDHAVTAGCDFVKILYLGDLDPSGEDMVRDIQDRLEMFGVTLDVEKVALTMNQVDQHRPPPNPTKLTDSRAQEFIRKYGRESWEVDALDPPTLQDLVSKALDRYTDHGLMKDIIAQEKIQKARIRKVLL
jgi:hypothetical protein